MKTSVRVPTWEDFQRVFASQLEQASMQLVVARTALRQESQRMAAERKQFSAKNVRQDSAAKVTKLEVDRIKKLLTDQYVITSEHTCMVRSFTQCWLCQTWQREEIME